FGGEVSFLNLPPSLDHSITSFGRVVCLLVESSHHLARCHGQQHGKAQFCNVPTIGNIKAELWWQQKIGRREPTCERGQDRNGAAEIDCHEDCRQQINQQQMLCRQIGLDREEDQCSEKDCGKGGHNWSD